MGERGMGAFHGEAWGNWVGFDPSVLCLSSPSPPAWPEQSVAQSPGAQGVGPWAQRWWEEWERR